MRRAIGIVRVSQTKGREGESFASPDIQLERIQAACKRDGLTLIETHDELDVSGGKALADRPGLSQAIDAIERGKAEVVVAAYFDRLFRSLSTQAEVIERVEAAGGQVLAVDVGRVTSGSAAQWLSGTMHGMMAEYFRRSVKDRSGDAQARAVARGVAPYPNVPLGYERDVDGRLRPDSNAPAVAEAFRMRAEGATIKDVRAFLAAHGMPRAFNAINQYLSSRVPLGEIHFGKLVNVTAHEPIVDRQIWDEVQRTIVPRGRSAKSVRLLARLGVLRCGSCDARLIVGSNNLGATNYRCPPTSLCPKRCAISAPIAEEVVSSTVRAALQDAQGRASIAESAQEAARAVETTQRDVDAILRILSATGAENESAAIERLTEAIRVRDEAQAHLDQIGPAAARTVSADVDWDDLSLEGRRELIRATVESAVVAPSGRGAERISVKLHGAAACLAE